MSENITSIVCAVCGKKVRTRKGTSWFDRRAQYPAEHKDEKGDFCDGWSAGVAWHLEQARKKSAPPSTIEPDETVYLAAAASDMLEALEAATALATCCMAQGCYSHDELSEMARATKPMFDAAIAKAKGGAA